MDASKFSQVRSVAGRGEVSEGEALVTLSRKRTAQLRLYCFSYAGGGPLAFRQWPTQLPEYVEVCAVCLPGHESRIRETPLNSIASIVAALQAELTSRIEMPYAFFGHSMGALIAFEMARQLRRSGIMQPLALFISGRSAPQCEPRPPIMHLLPEADFVKELGRLNGTPQDFFESPELADVMLPVLRADFAACETYEHLQEAPLDYPIYVLGGLSDDIAPAELQGWAAHTTQPVSIQLFPGDHFYIHSSRQFLTAAVSRHLNQLLKDQRTEHKSFSD